MLVSVLVSLATQTTLVAQTTSSPSKARVSVALDKYRLASRPVRIGRIEDASGLTYCAETKSLFLVNNDPEIILELGLDGTLKRAIRLKGFNDTEGIAHAGGSTFFIVEERLGNICRVTIGRRTKQIEYADRKVLKLHVESNTENKGMEGLAYDSQGQRLFSVKEKRPLKIYQIAVPKASLKKSTQVEFKNPWQFDQTSLGLKDVSAVHYDSESGHLLILSHESFCLVETTLDGKEISRLSLRRGSAGLTADVPQAEGVTMDDTGKFYICSEPNILYLFKKS